jgi:hypothetical protein
MQTFFLCSSKVSQIILEIILFKAKQKSFTLETKKENRLHLNNIDTNYEIK